MRDEPVFVVDLREPLEATGGGAEPTEGRATEPVARVAIIDVAGEVALHDIAPTDDRRFLDALARLIRFAHARRSSVRAVAERYGDEYERRLLFEKRLPAWAPSWPDRH